MSFAKWQKFLCYLFRNRFFLLNRGDFSDTIRYVVSHDGDLHRCYDVRKTQKNVPVFTIKTEDGREVTATANHRFMLADGTWKRLDELKPGDDLMEVTYEGQGHQSNNPGV